MTKKIPLSFNVPVTAKRVFEQIAAANSVKEKWAYCTAAILLLAEAGTQEQERLFRLVKSKDCEEEMEELFRMPSEERSAGMPLRQSSGMPLKRAAKPHPDR